MGGVTYQPNSGSPYSADPYALTPYSAPPVMRQPKSVGAAVALELIPGLFGIFGVGNMYTGRVGIGLALMLSFWALFWVNFLLIFIFVGWVTMPVTWVAYLIGGALLAAHGAERHNRGL